MYVKNVYKVTTLKLDIVKPEGIEDVWMAVQSCKLSTVILGCLYRHPKSLSCTYDYLTDVINFLSLKIKSLYILGDFNDDLFYSNSKLKKIITNAKLSQVITKATRITPSSATLLDVIITNNSKSVIHSDSIPCPVADHELITVTVNLQKPKRAPTLKTFRDLHFYSIERFCNLLRHESYELDKIFLTDNVETQTDIFTTCFMKCLDKCAPLVTSEVKRPSAPWINAPLKELMRERNNVQSRLKNDRHNISLQDEYKSLKKQVKMLLQTRPPCGTQ